MKGAEDGDGDDHWQRFENPEQPLVGERVTLDSFSKLYQSVDGADLIAWR